METKVGSLECTSLLLIVTLGQRYDNLETETRKSKEATKQKREPNKRTIKETKKREPGMGIKRGNQERHAKEGTKTLTIYRGTKDGTNRRHQRGKQNREPKPCC